MEGKERSPLCQQMSTNTERIMEPQIIVCNHNCNNWGKKYQYILKLVGRVEWEMGFKES